MPESQEFRKRYQQLNPAQKKAVDTLEGPVMVLAGPGTGKTETLAMRIANILLKTQMDPWNILCLTFTESGVAAMRNRLVSIVGTSAYYVHIHTFHSFCNDIIKSNPDTFTTTSRAQMVSDIELLELLRGLIDRLPGTDALRPFGDPYLYIPDIASDIKQLKQENISPKQFTELLDAIEKYTAASREITKEFFSLSPKERTAAMCDAFAATIVDCAKKARLPESLVFMLSRLYEQYSHHEQTADGAREQGKARTAYKNNVKAWYEKLIHHLPRQRSLATIYQWYQDELSKSGRYDYEDMITSVVREFRENDELLARYQEQFQYIFVDEYQDTNGAQNQVVMLLASFDEYPNVFVVGDDKQSIYRFQGASLTNMLEFYLKYKEQVEVLSLQENYRSQANVLRASDALISHNKESITAYVPGISATLHPARGLPEVPLDVREFESVRSEEYFIGTYIQGLLTQGVQPSDIAILVRYNKDSGGLFSLLGNMGVPVRLEAGENVLGNVCIQQMLTLLEYLSDIRKDHFLSDILRFDWLSLPPLDVLKVLHYAGSEHERIVAIIANEDTLHDIGVQNPNQFVAFATMLATFHAAAANSTLQDFLHLLFTTSGWLDAILQRPDKVSCLQKMIRLLEEAKQLNYSQHDLQIKEFIRRIALLHEHEGELLTQPHQSTQNAVGILTAHKAKGQEFDHVIITRLNNKHWGNNPDRSRLPLPHGFIRHDYILAGENNEDERRLFYVALTRAKKTILLTRSRSSDTGRPTVPSLFLQEMPAQVLSQKEIQEDESMVLTRITSSMIPQAPRGDLEGLKGWVEAKVKNHTLSVTHLNNYLECPKKFYVKNVLQLPSARSSHQALGSAVHHALEQFFAEYERRGKLPKREDLVVYFDRFIRKEVLTHEQMQGALDVGTQALIGYYDHYKDSFLPATKREYNFISHRVHVDGIPITGLIDKIELLDEAWKDGARIRVVDYKTGKPERASVKLKKGGEYWRQIVFYNILGEESLRFPYVFAGGQIDFIQPNEKGQYVQKDIAVSAEDISAVREEIRAVWKDIQNLKFLEDDVKCADKECEYCG